MPTAPPDPPAAEHLGDDPDRPSGLVALGWDDGWAACFADVDASLETPDPAAGLVPGRLVPGRLVAVDRGEVDVVVADGVVRAGSSLVDDPDPERAPCTGDWVAVRPASEAAGAELVALLPRRTAIVRATAGRSSFAQVLAANVDTVAVVVSLEDAELDLGRLERFVAVAWESGARPVVVLTKADTIPPAACAERTVDAAAVVPGVDVVVTSAPAGAGIDEARAVLTGTIALIGTSGAGKSTLANALLGDERLATGAVRVVDGKGRHTTVRRELVALPDGHGALIDTPGLRSVGLWDAADGIALVFADIDALADGCRFRDCGHEAEPGCAVRAAVDAGELPARRLESFLKLQQENEWEAARVDARLEAERKRDARSASTALRRHSRDRGRR